jgi:hypothetical protein
MEWLLRPVPGSPLDVATLTRVSGAQLRTSSDKRSAFLMGGQASANAHMHDIDADYAQR